MSVFRRAVNQRMRRERPFDSENVKVKSEFTPTDGCFRRSAEHRLSRHFNIILGWRLSLSQPLKGTPTLPCSFHAFSRRL